MKFGKLCMFSALLIVALVSINDIFAQVIRDNSNEVSNRKERPRLNVVTPVIDKNGDIVLYQVVLATKKFNELNQKIRRLRERPKIEKSLPIMNNTSVIGYSLIVKSVFWGKIQPLLGDMYFAEKVVVPFDKWLYAVALNWQKILPFVSSGNMSTYSHKGIKYLANAACGKVGNNNTIFLIGGGLNVRKIDTSNDSPTITADISNTSEAGLIGNPVGNGILMFGGKDLSGNFLDTIEKYDTGFSSTTKLIPNTTANLGKRAGSAVVTVNNKIYLFGGYNANGVLNEVFEFDGTTLNGVQKANMPKGLRFSTAISKGNYIYIFGGQESVYINDPGNGLLNQTVYRYDLVNNSWQTVGTSPSNSWLSSTTFAKDRNGEIHAIFPSGGGSGMAFGLISEISSLIMTETISGSVTTISWNTGSSFSTSPYPVGNGRFNYITTTCSDIYLIGGVYGRAGYSTYKNYENQVDKYSY